MADGVLAAGPSHAFDATRGNIIAKSGFQFLPIGRICGRAVYWLAVAFGLLFAVLALALKYAVLPNIERYQGEDRKSVV